jgi:acetyl esterase/lipase
MMVSRIAVARRVATAMAIVTAVLLSAGALPAGAQTTTSAPGSARVDDGETVITKGIPFSSVGSTELTMNVYEPEDPGVGRPAVILVHGGSWSQGTPDDMDAQGKLLGEQGWVGFSVSYRLSSKSSGTVWPGNLQDVQTAVRWVGDHAKEYGVDPTRLALLGNSAGGHLAAMVATKGIGTDPGAPPVTDPAKTTRVRAVAVWSAPLALDQLVSQNGNAPVGCNSDEACQTFWKLPLIPGMLGCTPTQCPSTYRDASPADLVTHTTAPMFLANSTQEIVPTSQTDAMDNALSAASVTHQVQKIDSDQHGSDYSSKVWNEMVPFLANQLGVPVPQPVKFEGDGRPASEYVGLILIGILCFSVLVGFLVAAIRHGWDEPS